MILSPDFPGVFPLSRSVFQFSLQVQTARMCTVSVIEDDKDYRDRLESLLQETGRYRLLYAYGSAESAWPHMKNHPPDIAVVDLKLPGLNGVELIALIRESLPATQCMVCSFYYDDAYIFSALQNGANGYVLKDAPPEQLLAALDELKAGGAPMSRSIARKVTGYFHSGKSPRPLAELTGRENEILHWLSKGLLVKELAAELFLSHHTVSKHIRNIYHKLQVNNRVEAVNKLQQQAFVKAGFL